MSSDELGKSVDAGTHLSNQPQAVIIIVSKINNTRGTQTKWCSHRWQWCIWKTTRQRKFINPHFVRWGLNRMNKLTCRTIKQLHSLNALFMKHLDLGALQFGS